MLDKEWKAGFVRRLAVYELDAFDVYQGSGVKMKNLISFGLNN